jgi:hypothetical protein
VLAGLCTSALQACFYIPWALLQCDDFEAAIAARKAYLDYIDHVHALAAIALKAADGVPGAGECRLSGSGATGTHANLPMVCPRRSPEAFVQLMIWQQGNLQKA